MDAKDFGIFLAKARKARDLTQAHLAEELHVTDKAVSRWERGIGLPDINTLEPLADALGLTLSDLMHCRDPLDEVSAEQESTLQDFITMLHRQPHIDWHSVRIAMLCLSALLALYGIFACPGSIAVHWHVSNGNLQANGWMASLMFFPLFVAAEFFFLGIWNHFEQEQYSRSWNAFNSIFDSSKSPQAFLSRSTKLVLDCFFFFCCGFVIPFCELFVLLANS